MPGFDNETVRLMREVAAPDLLKKSAKHNCQVSCIAVLFGEPVFVRLRQRLTGICPTSPDGWGQVL